jgi:hypothetical protein
MQNIDNVVFGATAPMKWAFQQIAVSSICAFTTIHFWFHRSSDNAGAAYSLDLVQHVENFRRSHDRIRQHQMRLLKFARCDVGQCQP